ncbi:MAG: biopolymer transporter ExbD [Acidobacteriota bacterium]
MGLNLGGHDGLDDELSPEINVTPLVDVFLILLLVFMITAPLLQHVIDVDLPEVSTARADGGRPPLTVVVGAEGSLSIDEEIVTLDEVVIRARAAEAARAERETAVVLRGDREAPYGYVLSVLDALRRAGVREPALVVTPLAEGGPG